MRHRRCRIDPGVLTALNRALGIYAPWRSNYLRMAIVVHVAHIKRLAARRAAKAAPTATAA